MIEKDQESMQEKAHTASEKPALPRFAPEEASPRPLVNRFRDRLRDEQERDQKTERRRLLDSVHRFGFWVLFAVLSLAIAGVSSAVLMLATNQW